MTIPDLSWQDNAECSDHPTWLFFTAGLEELAKRVCVRCPVAQECLNYALANREEGVWGGTDDKQRRRRGAAPSRMVVCAKCGDRFMPRNALIRFCSKVECQRARKTERNRRYLRRQMEAS